MFAPYDRVLRHKTPIINDHSRLKGTTALHHFELLVQSLIDLLRPMTNVKLDFTSISYTHIQNTLKNQTHTHTHYSQMLSDGDDVNNLNRNYIILLGLYPLLHPLPTTHLF